MWLLWRLLEAVASGLHIQGMGELQRCLLWAWQGRLPARWLLVSKACLACSGQERQRISV